MSRSLYDMFSGDCGGDWADLTEIAVAISEHGGRGFKEEMETSPFLGRWTPFYLRHETYFI